MNTKQIAAVVAVVVVIVVIVAAYALYSGGNDGNDDDGHEPGTAEVLAGIGTVYGNVNEDSYIDDDDIDIIERIIAGELDADDYPLADANLDGVVNSADLEIVRAAADGDSTTLYVVNNDGDAIAVSYPVGNYAFTSGTNMKSLIAVLGLGESMSAIGISTSTLSPVLDKVVYDGIEDGSITLLVSSQSLTVESLNTLVNLGVTLVIGEETGMSSETEIVEAMAELGITYLDLNVKSMDLLISTANTLGILMGVQDKAEAYTGWVNSVYEQIVESEGDQYGTATVLSVTMTNSVSGTSSDYYAMTVAAGGNNIADWTASTQNFGEGATWLLDEKYNADYIFHFRTVTYPDGMSESDVAKYASFFENTYTYQNGGYYLINGSLPLPVRLAVMAETMYPDCFEEGWAESLFQHYVTEFLGLDFDVSETEYVWNP